MQRMRTSLEVKENQWFTIEVPKSTVSIGFLERRLSLPAKGRTPVQQPRRWQIRGILTPSTKLTRRVVVEATKAENNSSREERVEMAGNYPAGVTDNDPHFDVPSVEDNEEPELPEHWYFTFGFGHVHPETGESLANHFVVIVGDVNSSREIMEHHFGRQWAFQYPSAEAAGVVKYRLKQLPMTPVPDSQKG